MSYAAEHIHKASPVWDLESHRHQFSAPRSSIGAAATQMCPKPHQGAAGREEMQEGGQGAVAEGGDRALAGIPADSQGAARQAYQGRCTGSPPQSGLR